MKKVVLFAITILILASASAFAANFSYKVAPATDDEKAAAKVVEAFVENHGGSYAAVAGLFTEDIKVCCFNIMGIQPSFEGKMKVAMFYTARSVSDKGLTDLVVRTGGNNIEIFGVHSYTVGLGFKNASFTYTTTWRLRKEDGIGYKIYEIVVQAR